MEVKHQTHRLLFVKSKVNYDRLFMDHIGRKKDKIFAEKLRARYIYDRPLLKYDRLFLRYAGRNTRHGEQGKV